MKKIVYILILLAIPLTSYAYTFTQTLTIGSTGNDVFELQKFLNTNPQTQVAITGPGSIGNETSYFGEKTKQAVIALQNLHSQNILIPNGLTFGTGFFGKSTMAFLNSQQGNIVSLQAPTSIQNINIINQANITTDLGYVLSNTVILAGENLYIGSQNNILNTEFYLNNILVQKECFNEFTCTLTIDKKMEAGTYTLTTNNGLLGTQNITITGTIEKKPVIETVILKINENNLITGKNLSQKVTVYTNFGVFESQTLNNSFILNFPKQNIPLTSNMQGIFFIENENGIRSDILIVQYEI